MYVYTHVAITLIKMWNIFLTLKIPQASFKSMSLHPQCQEPMIWLLLSQLGSDYSKSEVAQLCPTLCDPVNYSLPGSSVHGIFQGGILEWVSISFSRGSSQPRDRTQASHTVGRRFTVWATRVSGKWNDIVHMLLWLDSFTQNHAFDIHACRCLHQYFVDSYCQVMYH